MRLPERVRIGHADYRVVEEPWSWRKQEGCYGLVNSERLQIHICTEHVHPTLLLEVLLHEIIHACHILADIDDESLEEEVVTRSTPLLLQVFRDNPEVLRLVNTYASRG